MKWIKKLVKSLIGITEERFLLENLRINFKRGKLACIVTLAIEVVVTVTYLFYSINNNINLTTDGYIRMYFAFIILSTAFLITLILLLRKKEIPLKLNYLSYLYVVFIVLWNMGISLLDANISSYMLALMAIGVIVIFSPIKLIIILVAFQTIFFIIMPQFFEPYKQFPAVINSTIGAAVSWIAGNVLYRYRVDSYKSHKDLAFKTDEYEKLNQELNIANRKLEFLSQTDGLTGIHNRRMFDILAVEYWDECKMGEQIMSVIMIDIDHFKCYNDTYGHLAGDDCLVKIVSKLKNLLPEDCMLARYGGEEFAILIKGYDEKTVYDLAQMLREQVEELKIQHEDSLVAEVVTLSFGVYSGNPKEDGTLLDFISRADEALYSAKESGRNRVVEYARVL